MRKCKYGRSAGHYLSTGIWLVIAAVLMSSGACSSSAQEKLTPQQRKLAREIEQADLSVLFIGNSHSAAMPKQLKNIYSRIAKDQKICVHTCMAPFLVDHAASPATLNLIKAGAWDYVVLQGQKYSTTGKYTYPCDGALKLSEIVKDRGAKIIMFPEWSRTVEPNEYLRINKLHDEIAEQTGAKVAPIGQAWKKAIEEFPDTRFHARDGNHAAEPGNFLTSCVFFALLTETSPVDSRQNKERQRLAEIAWEIVNENR